MPKNLKFFNDEIVISDEKIAYNSLRQIFIAQANYLSNRFAEVYKKENRNLDDVFENVFRQGAVCIGQALDYAMEYLVGIEIYNMDKDTFISEYYVRYHVWDDYCNKIFDQYLEIVLDEKELDAYRKSRREHRARVIGGGFGLQGAVKGMATAGAINIAAGTIHGVFNGMAKVISSSAAASKKNRIFSDPKTLIHFVNGVENAIFNIHYALIDAVEDILGFTPYQPVSGKELEEAQRIFKNVKKYSFDKDKEVSLLKDILEIYPYNEEYYYYIISKYGDERKEIQSIASIFDVNIKEYKKNIIDNFYKSLKINTEKKALKAKKDLVEKANFIGCDHIEHYIGELDSALAKYDEEAKVFEGNVYSSRQEATDVRKEKQKIEELIKNINMLDENDLLNLKVYISNKNNFKTYTATDKYLEKVEKRIRKLDLKARTIDGRVYDNREEAEIVKSQKEILDRMTEKITAMSETELKTLKELIQQQDLRTDIKQDYITLVEQRLNALSIDLKKQKLDSMFVNIEGMNESELINLKNSVLGLGYEANLVNYYIFRIDKKLSKITDDKEEEEIIKVYNSVNKNNVQSLIEGIQKLNAFNNSIKNSYIGELEKSKNGIFKGKIDLARKYEQREKHGCLSTIFFYIIGIAFSLFLIGWLDVVGLVIVGLGYLGHFVNLLEMNKNKRAWEEITCNGKYPLAN